MGFQMSKFEFQTFLGGGGGPPPPPLFWKTPKTSRFLIMTPPLNLALNMPFKMFVQGVLPPTISSQIQKCLNLIHHHLYEIQKSLNNLIGGKGSGIIGIYLQILLCLYLIVLTQLQLELLIIKKFKFQYLSGCGGVGGRSD